MERGGGGAGGDGESGGEEAAGRGHTIRKKVLKPSRDKKCKAHHHTAVGRGEKKSPLLCDLHLSCDYYIKR